MARERIRGIDEPLPEGETLLWQGRPDAWALARYAFRVHWIGVYFLLLALAAVVTADVGAPVAARVTWIALLGAVVAGLVVGYAVLTARTTVYALTDTRIVMKVGVAFPAVFNLPFSRVAGAEARVWGREIGDVAFRIAGPARIGFIFLWPHTRPWQVADPQPMMRCVPDANRVAERIRDTLLQAGVDGHSSAADQERVEYRVMDDDGLVVLSNRSPASASEVT
jgi:hypothetical protein